MTNPTTEPVTSFAGAARAGKNAWWRFILALVLIVGLWLGATMLGILGFPDTSGAFQGTLTDAPAEREALIAFALLHVGFGGGALGLFLAVRYIHGRHAMTAITAAPRFRWWIFALAAGLALFVALALTPFTDARGTEAIESRMARFSATDWAMLFVVYASGVLIQASWEEVLTRGWLLQQVNLVARSPWIAVAVSTLVFVAMHIGHPGWATFVTAGLMGAAFGWSAIRLNGLEAAIGAHVANNLLGGLLAGAFLAGNPRELGTADVMGVLFYVASFVALVEFCARRGGGRVTA